jgi:hypothetical protein
MKTLSWSTIRIKGQPVWPRCANCNQRFFALAVREKRDDKCKELSNEQGRHYVPVKLEGYCICGKNQVHGYCTESTWHRAVQIGKRSKPKD